MTSCGLRLKYVELFKKDEIRTQIDKSSKSVILYFSQHQRGAKQIHHLRIRGLGGTIISFQLPIWILKEMSCQAFADIYF